MVQKMEVHGEHTTVTGKLRQYVIKKIGGLDRYLPRHSRASAHMTVHLKETNSRDHNNCLCEVVVRLPKQTITIHESAMNMYAAVDICTLKLKQQLHKYKELHDTGKTRRHLFGRIKRQQGAA